MAKMKIGLLRHFKTDHQFPGRCNSEEYDREYLRYEQSSVILPDCIVSTDGYSVCYASTTLRAVETAQAVFKKEIIPTDELAEVPLQAIFRTKLQLPLKLWHFINRVGWAFNSRKLPETRTQTKERAVKFLSRILGANSNKKNILLVTHGFFMFTLQFELLKRGFKGKEIIKAKHGKLYEFVRG
jgi:hypothetical protein